MDIKNFETAYLNAGGKPSELEKEDGEYVSSKSQMGWQMWLAAKAQAVPEGFVAVAKELPEKIAEKMAIDRIDKPIHENDPVWSEIAEESYKNQVKLKKWEFGVITKP